MRYKKNIEEVKVTTRRQGVALYIMGIYPTTTNKEVTGELQKYGVSKDEIENKRIRKGRYEKLTAKVEIPIHRRQT